jgi:drug/metabolite transporter superfamily protein YnfA
MIFCRGCGKELHESALQCPHCGAPQTISSSQSESHWSSVAALIFGIIAFLLALMESDGKWDRDTVVGGVFVGLIPVILNFISLYNKPNTGMWMGATGSILGILVILLSIGSM